MKIKPFWDDCLSHLRAEFSPAFFDAFIRSCQLEQRADGALLLRCPNQATMQWFKNNADAALRALIKDEFADGAAATPPKLSYKVVKIDDLPTKSAPAPAKSPISKNAKAALAGKTAKTGLSSRFSFDNFVVGESNELAFMIARKIAANDMLNTGAFFLSGPTGLGKTHLVHALGNAFARDFPGRRVLLTTGRQFMNDVIQAFQSKQHAAFKDRYYSPDMLIIDDIQHIGGDKVRTQEEFFFLFNELADHSKKIVLTSDRAPAALKNAMPERLTSRLISCLTTFITPPAFELRADIIRQKAAEMPSFRLDDDSIRFLAENIRANVREIEGALNRVAASAAFSKVRDVSVPFCRRILSDLIGGAGPMQPETIIEKTAEFFHIRVSDIKSKKRNKNLMMPRHIAIYLCRQLTRISLPDIGRHFSSRNHSTILASCRKIEGMQNDADTLDALRKIEMAVKDTRA